MTFAALQAVDAAVAAGFVRFEARFLEIVRSWPTGHYWSLAPFQKFVGGELRRIQSLSPWRLRNSNRRVQPNGSQLDVIVLRDQMLA